MADKQVLYNVEIKLGDAVNKLAELDGQLADISKSLKDKSAELREAEKAFAEMADKDSAEAQEEQARIEELRREIVVLKEERKAVNKEAGEYSRQIQNEVIQSGEYADTLKGLCAQLSAAKDELRAMSLSDPGFAAKAEEVNQLNDRVKEMEASYGVFTRNVGNYEGAMQNIIDKNIPFIKQITQLTGGAKTASGAIKNMTTAAQGLGKQLLALCANPIVAIIAAIVTVIMAVVKAIKSSEEQTQRFNAILAPLQRVLSAVMSVFQKLAGIIASAIEGVMKLADAFMSLMEKLPFVGKYIKEINDANREAIELAKREADLVKQTRADRVQDAKDELEVSRLRNEVAKKDQYTSEQRLEMLQKAEQLEADIAKREYDRAKEEYDIALARSKWAENSTEEMDKLAELEEAMYKAEEGYYNSTRRMATQIATLRKEMANDAYQTAKSNLDAMIALRDTAFKKHEKYEWDYTKTSEENAEAEFWYKVEYDRRYMKEREDRQKAQLKLDLNYGKITVEQYRATLRQMKEDRKAYDLAEFESIEAHQRSLVDAAIALAGGKELEAQLDDLRAKYRASEKAIREDAYLSAEERTFYLTQLETRRLKEERGMRLNAEKETAKEIQDAAADMYADDLRRFSDDELERIALERDTLNAIIAMRRDAGLDTYEEERRIDALDAKARTEELNRRLREAWASESEQFDIRMEFLEEELAREDLASDRRAALEEQMTELIADHNRKRLDSYTDFASQVMSVLSSVNEMMDNLGDAQADKAEARNDRQKADLEKRLNAGLISQKQYDRQVEKLDEQLDAEKAEISRRQAVREKALSAMEIAVNTATAIMKIWAEVPKMDFGVSTVALTAIAAAVGAAQLAAVLSEPLPTAAAGGLVKGAKHEQGGVLVNTEGDERIISAQPSKAFPELLNLISYIGKHPSVPDTGWAYGTAAASQGPAAGGGVDYDLLADKVGERFTDAVKGIRVYTAIEDVRKGEEEYARIVNSSRL